MKPRKLSLTQWRTLALVSRGWVRRTLPTGRWAEVNTGSVVDRTVASLIRLGLVVADGDTEIAQLTDTGRAEFDARARSEGA